MLVAVNYQSGFVGQTGQCHVEAGSQFNSQGSGARNGEDNGNFSPGGLLDQL